MMRSACALSILLAATAVHARAPIPPEAAEEFMRGAAKAGRDLAEKLEPAAKKAEEWFKTLVEEAAKKVVEHRREIKEWFDQRKSTGQMNRTGAP